MPKCPFCAEPVPLATAHILAADIVLRRTLEFLDAALPVLAKADPEERLMQFATPLQDAIDTYTELRLGCASRCDVVSNGNENSLTAAGFIPREKAPCICVFKDGERFQHPECFTFHKERAVGVVKNPLTLEVHRGHPLADSPPAPITERSIHRG